MKRQIFRRCWKTSGGTDKTEVLLDDEGKLSQPVRDSRRKEQCTFVDERSISCTYLKIRSVGERKRITDEKV